MRTVPTALTDAWHEGDFLGENRPMARVTIQKIKLSKERVDAERLYTSAIFGQASVPRELPNIKSVAWDRTIGADVATATIVLYNTTPKGLGWQPDSSGDLDRPGYYTFNHGATEWSNDRWGYEPNKWQNWLVPDRVIRTYEGYGFDPTVRPEDDTNLVITGTWLIDDVEYTADGLITLSCRDLGRLLLDQWMFPPVVPLAAYPLSFDKYRDVENPDIVHTSGDTFRPSYLHDSGVPYYGENAWIHGHRPSHAFDGSTSSYWLSVGNSRPSAGYSFEFVEGSTGGKDISAVRFKVWGGPYKVYLSLKRNGQWLGRSKIPYDPDNPISAPNGADIKFVKALKATRNGTHAFKFDTPVQNVDAIRLSFTNLYNSGIGPFVYRAGLRDVVCSSQVTTTTDGGTHREGDYDDYSQIVKYLLALGGFHWPRSDQGYITRTDGTKVVRQAPGHDSYLKRGRIWGDVQPSYTAGEATLTLDLFDKKPLMDGIAYVRDILGFIFYIDPEGGAVFRMPNIWKVGNYTTVGGAKVHTDDVLTVDETQVILGLRAKLSSRNIRDRVFVANVSGNFAGAAAGYNPIKPNPGLRRVTIYSDQHFENENECQVMADLITLRQLFQYRTDTLTITANPAIEIDDQIRIYERVTNEGFIHYVQGIQSNNDLESGRWTYDLSTHWLGEEPFTKWAFNANSLTAATKQFLAAMGIETEPS